VIAVKLSGVPVLFGFLIKLASGFGSQRVSRTLDTLASAIEHVGIDHCRTHILMSQQLLDRPDVVACLKQMGGK